MREKRTTIVIELNGGLIQAIYGSDGESQEDVALVIDWDRDEEPEEDRSQWAFDTLRTIKRDDIKAPEATIRDLHAWVMDSIGEEA